MGFLIKLFQVNIAVLILTWRFGKPKGYRKNISDSRPSKEEGDVIMTSPS